MVFEPVSLGGSFERESRIRVAECLSQIDPKRWTTQSEYDLLSTDLRGD